MYGDGIGQLQLLQLLIGILHLFPFVKGHGHQLGQLIDILDDADIPIEDPQPFIHRDVITVADLPLELIIVLGLHHLIAHSVDGMACLLFLFPRRVQKALEDPVQSLHPQGAFTHRGHDLDVQWLCVDVSGQLLPD